ncbi:MAG: DUF86 domain-containing protein [Planctomycetota bacterium]|nr:DUF86 domain-containing protein [Planctomycetota bacterium]
MPPERDAATLLDLVHAARLVASFVEGMDYAAFQTDPKTQSAIIHQLLVIGEATKRLSDDFKNGNPSIPWRDMARMRDKMVHHYEAIDVGEIWRATRTDIPKLLETLEPLAPDRET